MSDRFEVKLSLGNAAFRGGNHAAEISRILETIARRLEDGEEDGTCYDVNGNPAGNWSLDIDLSEEWEEKAVEMGFCLTPTDEGEQWIQAGADKATASTYATAEEAVRSRGGSL